MKKILVAVDGSETSIKAAEQAIDIAKHYDATVTFLTVVDVDMNLGEYGVFTVRNMPIEHKEIVGARNDQNVKMLNAVVDKLDTTGIKTDKRVIVGIAYEEIALLAEKDKYDLVVMGRRGLTKVERFFMGSNTQRVLASVSCSVLVVKE